MLLGQTRLGGVAEWLKATVLKTVRRETVSGVRIPPPPISRFAPSRTLALDVAQTLYL